MTSLFSLFFSRAFFDEAIAKKISRMSENEAQTLKARRQKAASKQKRFLIVRSSLEPRHKVRDEPVVKRIVDKVGLRFVLIFQRHSRSETGRERISVKLVPKLIYRDPRLVT